jgi:hypothetical protein
MTMSILTLLLMLGITSAFPGDDYGDDSMMVNIKFLASDTLFKDIQSNLR